MQDKKIISTGVITAVMASLCCVAPLLALITGVGTLATAFSWVEPLRPYLMVASVTVLGWAWYQKLKKQPEDACGCDPEIQQNFLQTKAFLAIVTLFSALMLLFPYYSAQLYPTEKNKVLTTVPDNQQTVTYQVNGMTCTGCEANIHYQIKQLTGIQHATVSYESQQAIVVYDTVQVTKEDIGKAIEAAGYQATLIK